MKNPVKCTDDRMATRNLDDPLKAPAGDTGREGELSVSQRQWYWLGLGVVALVFVGEIALTWRKWVTLTGDAGTELYLPWRLSQGAVLYRDLYFFAGGPLSQYFEAILFKLFGASFLTFAISNLAATAAMLWMVFRSFTKSGDSRTAVMICVGIIVVFAFGCYFYEGFNYVAPYSTEALHGLVLSVFTIALLSNWISRNQLRCAILAGFCSGLVFLTKPDIFVALAACGAIAFALMFFLYRRTELALRSLGAFLLAALIPSVAFFLYFWRVEDVHDSLRSVIFAWVPLFDAAVVKCAYYQWCTGLDRPYFHLRNILFQSVLVAAVISFYAAAFRAIKTCRQDWTRIQRRAVPAFVPILLALFYADHWRLSGECFSTSFVVMLVCLWLLLAAGTLLVSLAASRCKTNIYRSPWAVVLMLVMPVFSLVSADWIDCGYSLPLLTLVSCTLIYWNRHLLQGQQRFIFPFLWSVFGLALLCKMGLFPRIWHYGFVLAMPAFVSAIYFLFWLLPRLLENKWQVSGGYFRLTVFLVFMVGFWALFQQSARNFAGQDIAVGFGGDRILASDKVEHAEIFNAAVNWIQTNVSSNATIAAVPQGPVINYLSRRVNPSPCVFWDPNIMSIFGQVKMTAAFEQSAPDYVLIVERKFGPIDRSYFGSQGYGGDLMQWIEKNYQTQILIGDEPLKNGAFGIKILKRLNAPLPANYPPLAGGHRKTG